MRKETDFKTLPDFGGIASNASADKIPDRNAVSCSNIDFSTNGLIQTRGGYRQYANKNEAAGRCLDAFLFRKNFGTIKDVHLRVRSDANESIVEFLDKSTPEQDGVYKKLIGGLEPMTSMSFAVANGDGGVKVNKVIMSNGVDTPIQWNGAMGVIDSVTSSSIVCDTELAKEGFDNQFNKKLIIEGVNYTYGGITNNTFTGVSPNPSSLSKGTTVVQVADNELLEESLIMGNSISFQSDANPKINDSGSRFISAGFKVGMSIVVGGSEFNDGVYLVTGVTAGTLTLSNTNYLNNESAGKVVAVSAGVPKGNILMTSQRKLWVSGTENESKVYYSMSGNVTCFGIGAGLGSGGSFDVLDGSGAITCLESKGRDTVIIHKKDAVIAYSREAVDAMSVRESFDTLAVGNGVGASYKKALVNYNQSSYYMTSSEGVKDLSRAVNEDILTVQSITNHILPSLKDFDNSTASAVYFASKRLILIATNNNKGERVVISIYIKSDEIFDISIDTIPVADWIVDGDNLYFVSSLDQNTYKMFDRNSDNNVFVKHNWTSKDFTFLEPARGKEFNTIYIEGFIKVGTNININVFYGIGGNRGVNNHVIRHDDLSTVSFASYGALGDQVIGEYSIGSRNEDLNNSKYFSLPIHFDVNKATRFRVQIETYYETEKDYDKESYWAINNISFNPILKDIMYNEVRNSNDESNRTPETDAIITEAEEFIITEEGDFIIKN